MRRWRTPDWYREMTVTIVRMIAPLALLVGTPVAAQQSPFHAGTAIPAYGRIATIDSDLPIPKGTVFKVDFDASAKAKPGEVDRIVDAAIRFINMHVEAGVPVKDIHVALVFHGPAAFDLTSDPFYAAHAGPGATTNATAPALAALIAKGARVYLCGQSAAAQGIAKADLLPGVKMALSAMTAHALLQQQGYTLNP